MIAKLLVLFCLLSTQAYAIPVSADPETIELATEFEKQVIALRAQTVIDLVNEELRQQGVIEAFPTEEDAIAARLLLIAETAFADNAEARARLKFIDWKGAARWIRDRAVGLVVDLRTQARMLGVDVALFYLISTIINDIIPIILTAAGNPALAATVLATPAGTGLSILYAGLKGLIKRKKHIKLYGGREVFRYYRNLEIAVRKKLNHKKDSDIFSALTSPTANGEDNMVVLTNDGIFRDTLEFLNLKDRRFSFRDLKKIAKKYGLPKEELKAIKAASSDKSIRSAMLFTWIETHLSKEEMAAVKSRYAESFTRIENEPKISALTQWAGLSLDARQCTELQDLVKVAPDGVPVPLVVEVWQRVMLPEIAERFKGARLIRFHKMVKHSENFNILGRIAIDKTWNKDWTAALLETLHPLCRN